ncbi:SGNH/GDSL hydrolase family protein [Anaerocolumna xylanovorans]|uniref:Lysophospholipase L1 n=1 Tax=Anaerocolumna xylanovorans DSM 12503 TaxID=1121345 RepID=A0A1M7YDD0_9FIRM|nr:SGNH/GDSL hydrolase family protein [Anaerocolumna xylanovorans]SHO50644.1 Lysophospholipase L1 [Anaerocolumna xylanovorans DSM 12503]
MLEKMVNIGVFGDSILKGIQINPVSKKYYVNNTIDIEILSKKYPIQIQNYSSFGCTVKKGSDLLRKRLEKNIGCNAIVMDYGGNDCDYNWKAISENPGGNYSPNTPIELFSEIYCGIIDTLKKKGILPILTTLPPLEPQSFFDWFCRNLNKKNILMWLGDINNIYFHQESYSRVIEKIALETQVPLIDLRGAFLKAGNIKELLCEDGTHPNTSGQKIIASSFENFAKEFIDTGYNLI